MAYNDVSYDEVATGTKLSGPTKNRDESAPIVDGAEVLYDGLKYDDDEGTYQFTSVKAKVQSIEEQVNQLDAKIPYTIVTMTQADYDALGTYDDNTLYLIKE